jgi:hypothetical protein
VLRQASDKAADWRGPPVWLRRAGPVVGGVAAAFVLVVTATPATHAARNGAIRSTATANSGVYAVMPTWWGWCPGWGNYATYAYYINFTTGTQYGDWGDDIVWMRVANNQWNSLQVGVQCRWSPPQGWNFSIFPTRYGQTFWFGYPGGTYHN